MVCSLLYGQPSDQCLPALVCFVTAKGAGIERYSEFAAMMAPQLVGALLVMLLIAKKVNAFEDCFVNLAQAK